jgi:hypothetical protein
MTVPNIEHIHNDHVGKTRTIHSERQDTESVTSSVARNLFTGFIIGAIGVIPIAATFNAGLNLLTISAVVIATTIACLALAALWLLWPNHTSV